MLGVIVCPSRATRERLPPGGRAVGYLGVALAWGFVAVGSYVTLRRPDRRTGVLMISVGLVTLTTGLQFSDARAAVARGRADGHARAGGVRPPPAGLPVGAAREPWPSGLVVAAGYVVATLLQLPPLLFGLDYNCDGSACPRNLLRIAREPDVAATFSTAQTLAELVVIAGALVLLARRWRAASRGAASRARSRCSGSARRSSRSARVSFASGARRGGGVAQLLFLSALALLPLAFLAGLVRTRFFRTATVARLIDPPRGRRGGGAGGAERRARRSDAGGRLPAARGGRGTSVSRAARSCCPAGRGAAWPRTSPRGR